MMQENQAPVPPDLPDGPFLYFAYGSNLRESRLRENCPSAHLVTIASLPDYRLGFTRFSLARRWRGSGVADVVPSPGDVVWGAVWMIEAADSVALDRQEGLFLDPPGYRRVRVEVWTPAGDAITCRSYQVVDPELEEEYLPTPQYKANMIRGARSVGLPRSYIKWLESLKDYGIETG